MIENPRAGRIRAIAKLQNRRARTETGLFLLEGPQAVAEALTYRPELVVELYATPTALERYRDIGQSAVDAGVDVEFVSERVLESMAGTVTPQGIVAVCHQFPTALKDLLPSGPEGDIPGLVAILEQVRDPGNAGTIIRAADAAGAHGVVFSGRSVDLYNPKVVRSSTGSLFHLPIAVGAELPAVAQRCRDAGIQIFAADVSGDSLLELRGEGILAQPTAWLFGNEARGLAEQDRALADRVVSVPLYGLAESMNLATAASVCLYETAFAQRESV